MFPQDPGPCPICGAAHTACKPAGALGSTTIVLLPNRDAAAAAEAPAVEPVAVEPEPVPFTTSTYDRTIHGPKRPRR